MGTGYKPKGRRNKLRYCYVLYDARNYFDVVGTFDNIHEVSEYFDGASVDNLRVAVRKERMIQYRYILRKEMI